MAVGETVMDDIKYTGDDVVDTYYEDADPNGRQSAATIAVVGVIAVAVAAAMLFLALL